MQYVNVVIENNTNQTDNLYTYGSELPDLAVGDKVYVPFAAGNRLKPAYVFEVLEGPPEGVKTFKMVESRDEHISLPKDGPALCGWMRKRYFCRYIDGVKCFTPAGTSSKRGKERRPYKDIEIEAAEHEVPPLTDEQEKAVAKISPFIEQKIQKTFLIHGVTSSGKTEVYMQIAEKVLGEGRSAIVLVPEISLTTQTVTRFLGRFGKEQIAVLHSKLSLGERYDEWMRAKTGQVKIVIGARSAIFAPFDDIGAVIIDEEHETTYKSDMAPKYDTIEVAIKRTAAHGGVLVLGSATPSLVSAYRAEEGHFEKIELKKRYNQTPLPQVEVVDMRDELRQGNKSIFSLSLYNQITHCLETGKQAILFLNRRGYSTFISCRSCGYVVRCPYCGISLTYHKGEDEALCHFCGTREKIPELCPQCESRHIRYFGTGTEKVEELTKEAFPGAVVDRLDMDTAQRKGSIDRILGRFQKGKTNILIGTQLVAKGLDFENVGLVGIISADLSLNIPDFRSPERTFQLITQAAGRAGRGEETGNVIIQSYTPEHYAVITAARQDYQGFYEAEMPMRKQLGYPPFSCLIQILVSSLEEEKGEQVIDQIKEQFLLKAGQNEKKHVLGPKPAPMSKVGDKHRFQLLIKCFPGRRRLYTEVIDQIRRSLSAAKENKGILITVDVDPFSFV